ncbi:MAG: hypothetical protein JXJ04_17700, partial [Spirochaetales bacterium]|nr:hypothetical protein [Spirochaetales bacterium]
IEESNREKHAAGDLCMVSGKVEITDNLINVFEDTVKCNVIEETGRSLIKIKKMEIRQTL